MIRPDRHSPGFALLIVLWVLVPLSSLMLVLTSSARSEGQLTFTLRDRARLVAAADGGIATAMFALRQPGSAPPAPLRIADMQVTVAVVSLAGLLNPNTVPPELLRALLSQLGAGPEQAFRLASAIVDWRTPGQRARDGGARAAEYRAAGRDYGPPGAPFESVDELRLVLGMTPALFAALQPYITLETDRPPDPAVAPPAVRAALSALSIADRGPGVRSDVFRITAEAIGMHGVRVARRATVKLTPSPRGQPWRILAWDTAPDR